MGLPLILGIYNMNTLRWNVDAGFGVHNDMKSHTVITMTMGQGAALSKSTKQKLNTNSSTEAELVGIDDEILPII